MFSILCIAFSDNGTHLIINYNFWKMAFLTEFWSLSLQITATSTKTQHKASAITTNNSTGSQCNLKSSADKGSLVTPRYSSGSTKRPNPVASKKLL